MSATLSKISKGWAVVLILWAGLWCGVVGANAQDDEKAGPAVTFRMVCLRHVPGKTELHLAPDHLKGLTAKKDAGTSDPIRPAEGSLTLPQNNLSPWLRARPVDNELVFYLRPEEVEDAAAATVPEVAARAVFPAEMPREVFLLFVPAPASAEGGINYRVAVIDASDRTFPAATHLLYNLSNSQIRGKFAQNGFSLSSGQRHLVGAISTSHPRGYFEVLLEQRAPTADPAAGWERLARTQWKADETARRLCLIFDDPAQGRIAVRTFNEYLIAIKPPDLPSDPRARPDDGLTKEPDDS